MALRPVAARWFELITVRKDLARAVAALARTGAVQLEAGNGGMSSQAILLPDLETRLKSWSDLARRYAAYWPQAEATPAVSQEPELLVDAALGRIAAWRAEADPLIDRIEAMDADLRGLDLLVEALSAAVDAPLPPLDLVGRGEGRVVARLIAYPAQGAPHEMPPVLMLRISSVNQEFLLLVGRVGDIGEIETQAASLKGQVVPLPKWLPSGRGEAVDAVSRKRAEVTAAREALNRELATLSERHGIAAAICDLRLVEWLAEHSSELRASERLVWATGWTSDPDATRLRAALAQDGVHALVRLGAAPPERSPPLLMRNPRWARGFEAFVRMLGTPTASEADPSAVVAVIAPLLFGFMFADVGQGLVLVAAGLWFKRRVPFLSILVPGGILGALFGVVFGSVFCREDIITPLWVHPLAQPLTILGAALAAGAAILSLGLLLDALQSFWRGQGRHWLFSRAGLLLAYVGFVASPLDTRLLWLIAVGATWFAIGTAATQSGRNRATALVTAAAEFAEQASQLAINTLSFARVGAFALAHAGLSGAVVGLADAAGGVGYWLVLALGNALIILLEGLVVGIQTTRLVLFEFFIRFLKGGGRDFKPLAPPVMAGPAADQVSQAHNRS